MHSMVWCFNCRMASGLGSTAGALYCTRPLPAAQGWDTCVVLCSIATQISLYCLYCLILGFMSCLCSVFVDVYTILRGCCCDGLGRHLHCRENCILGPRSRRYGTVSMSVTRTARGSLALSAKVDCGHVLSVYDAHSSLLPSSRPERISYTGHFPRLRQILRCRAQETIIQTSRPNRRRSDAWRDRSDNSSL